MLKWILGAFIYLIVLSGYCQTNVAITIDDVPNTSQSTLLEKLDILNIPIAIFINEGLVYKTDSVYRNLKLLDSWSAKPYTTLGNHSYSHPKYSDIDFDSFKADVIKGQRLTKALAKKHNKSLGYFRFPFNDLGRDATQHQSMDSLLRSLGYVITPFTIESSDWMFSYIYDYYLAHNENENARKIGERYVSTTLNYFHFFDSLTSKLYGRRVNQIYLCHDNTLNTDYLPEIVNQLKDYKFVSLDEATKDPAYQQENQYYKKWGVSWFYRWMNTQEERVKWMRAEPDMADIELLYHLILNEK